MTLTEVELRLYAVTIAGGTLGAGKEKEELSSHTWLDTLAPVSARSFLTLRNIQFNTTQ